MKKPSLFFPLFLIAVGGLWFLRSMDLIPNTSTIFSIAFVAVGLISLILEGLTKSSVVSAPVFIYCGIAIYITEANYLTLSSVIGLGIFIFGICLLIARTDILPDRRQKITRKNDNLPPFQ